MYCLIDVQPIRLSPDELPALAFGSHYSVFKERPGTHQSSRCWCRVCRRTAPDEPASLLQLPKGLGGPFRRECHCSRRMTERQRAFRPEIIRGAPRAAASPADRSGTSAVTDGCPPERPGSLQAQASRRHQLVACGRPPGLPHATRCSMRNELSAPLPPTRWWERALPDDALDYRMSPRCDACMMDRRCCRVVTGR